MPRSILVLFLAALPSLGSGCVSLGRQYEGASLPKEALATVEVGITTRQQILERFGPPLIVQRQDIEGLVRGIGSRFTGDELVLRLDPELFNEVFVYEYRRVNRFALLLGVFNYISSVDKSDRLMFFFDDEARVVGFGITEGTKEL